MFPYWIQNVKEANREKRERYLSLIIPHFTPEQSNFLRSIHTNTEISNKQKARILLNTTNKQGQALFDTTQVRQIMELGICKREARPYQEQAKNAMMEACK